MTPFKMSHTCAGWSKRLSLKHTSNGNMSFTLCVLKASHLYWTYNSIRKSQWNQADAIKFFTRTATQKTVTGHFLLCAQYKDVILEVDQNWREWADTGCCSCFKTAAFRGRQSSLYSQPLDQPAQLSGSAQLSGCAMHTTLHLTHSI